MYDVSLLCCQEMGLVGVDRIQNVRLFVFYIVNSKEYHWRERDHIRNIQPTGPERERELSLIHI